MNFFRQFLGKVTKNQFWKSIVTLSAGQIIAQSMNILIIPIISRIYSKEAYGDFAIVTSTATIIIGFVGMGLCSAIMAADGEEETNKVFSVGFYIQAILATIFIFVMLALMPVYRFFESSIWYPLALIIMYFYIILSVLSSQLIVYINRLKKDKVLFFNSFRGALSNILITLPLGLLGVDDLGMYIAMLVSLVFVNVNMLRHVKPFYSNIKLKDFNFIIKKFKDFIKFQYPANMLGIFSNQLPTQLLSLGFGISSLGDFFMCNRVFQIPFSLISTPIQTVYFRTASQKFKDKAGEDIADLTYSLISKIMYIAFIPVLFIMIFGKPLFEFVLGPTWGVAGEISSILALQFLFTFCISCIAYCRVVIAKQKINLYVSIIQLFIITISLIYGVFIIKSFLGTIFCYSISNTIFSILNLVVSFWCLEKYFIKFALFSIIYCVVCIGISVFVKQILF